MISYIHVFRNGVATSSRYLGVAYLGYKCGKITNARFFKNRANEPIRILNNPNSKFQRVKKKIKDIKWLNKILKPGPIGAATAVVLLFTCERYIIPLIIAGRAKSFFDDCFDEKLLEKYNIKPLKIRIEEDDWPTNIAKLLEEIGLEEKAQICSLWYEDVSTLDSRTKQIHFILSCIFFLSEKLLTDDQLYNGFLAQLLQLLRAGKLSRALRRYILILLRRRGIPIPHALEKMLES